MARHEPLGRPAPGDPPGMKVTMRRDEDGTLRVVVPRAETVETTEAAERPPMPDDPRTATQRNVPPHAAGGV